MTRGDLFRVRVRNTGKGGREEEHWVAVVQADDLTSTANVLVCPISTEQAPAIHRRDRDFGLVGGLLQQEPFDAGKQSYLHVEQIVGYPRKGLRASKWRLTEDNLSVLDLALIRVYGIPVPVQQRRIVRP